MLPCYITNTLTNILYWVHIWEGMTAMITFHMVYGVCSILALSTDIRPHWWLSTGCLLLDLPSSNRTLSIIQSHQSAESTAVNTLLKICTIKKYCKYCHQITILIIQKGFLIILVQMAIQAIMNWIILCRG